MQLLSRRVRRKYHPILATTETSSFLDPVFLPQGPDRLRLIHLVSFVVILITMLGYLVTERPCSKEKRVDPAQFGAIG